MTLKTNKEKDLAMQQHRLLGRHLVPGRLPTRTFATTSYLLTTFVVSTLCSNSALAEDTLAELANQQGQVSAAAHISTISDEVLTGASGLVRVNLTAGDGNVQQNSAAAAHSKGLSSAVVSAQQHTDMVTTDSAQLLSAGINDLAFSDAQGIIQVNQSAGVGNAQLNGAAIAVAGLGAFAFVELNDKQLMDQASPTGSALNSDQPNQQTNVTLAPGAFQNASGVIQINQAAGNNNNAANSFTMSVSP